MLGGWFASAIIHFVVVATRETEPALPASAWLLLPGVAIVGMWILWSFLDEPIDRAARRHRLDAGLTRAAFSVVCGALVAMPASLALAIAGFPFSTIATAVLVYMPWALLLAWMLRPGRSP
jgi:hypothetical protein